MGPPFWRLVFTYKVKAYDTVPKAFFSVPSPIANDGAFCRNEQSIGMYFSIDYATSQVASASQSAYL